MWGSTDGWSGEGQLRALLVRRCPEVIGVQGRTWMCAALALVVALGLVTTPTPAGAHPSALNSLTLDFIVDQSGLVVIDGAANRATYEDAPTPAERSVIVGQVVDAIGVPSDTVQVD